AHLVFPVDFVGGEAYQAKTLGKLGIDFLPGLRAQLAGSTGLAEESAFEARQPVAHRQRAEVHAAQRDPRRLLFISAALAAQHVAAICRERQLEKRARETGTRLDQRKERARADIEPLQRALEIEDYFAREPIFFVRQQEAIVRLDHARVAVSPKDPRPNRLLVEPQMKDRIFQFAGNRQRPEIAGERIRVLD